MFSKTQGAVHHHLSHFGLFQSSHALSGCLSCFLIHGSKLLRIACSLSSATSACKPALPGRILQVFQCVKSTIFLEPPSESTDDAGCQLCAIPLVLEEGCVPRGYHPCHKHPQACRRPRDQGARRSSGATSCLHERVSLIRALNAAALLSHSAVDQNYLC